MILGSSQKKKKKKIIGVFGSTKRGIKNLRGISVRIPNIL